MEDRPDSSLPRMSPQRRTALVSVGAACLLIAIKLADGACEREPRAAGGGRALGHRSRGRAAHVLRRLGRCSPGRHRTPVGAREGRAPGRARRSRVPDPGQRRDRAALRSLVLPVRSRSEVDATWWTFAAIALVIAIDAIAGLGLAARRAPLSQRRAPCERAPLRKRPRRNARRARRVVGGGARLSRGRRDRRALRRGARRSRPRCAFSAGTCTCSWTGHRPTRRTPRARRSTRSTRRWSSGGSACASRAADTSRTSSSGSPRALRSDRATPRRTGSRTRYANGFPMRTSSSTWSRAAPTRRSASGCWRPRCAFRRCARSTTWRSSRSTGASRSRSI